MAFLTPAISRAPRRARVLRPICAVEKPPDETVSRGLRVLEAPYAFGYVVRGARYVWRTIWTLMMAELAPSSSTGAYVRPKSQFSSGGTARDVTHLTLYEGVACPWCHRAMLARALLGLDVSVVRVIPGDDGLWRLPDGRRLRDVYNEYAPTYSGRYTAPLLVDTNGGELVSNESADILCLFDTIATVPRSVIGDARAAVHLRPWGNSDVDALCERIYQGVNNGVYQCGFATTQVAYEKAEALLFDTLDELERRLQYSRFLCSATLITEADVRLFPTVYRFDAVYGVLFKACRKSISADYPAIFAWMTGTIVATICVAFLS